MKMIEFVFCGFLTLFSIAILNIACYWVYKNYAKRCDTKLAQIIIAIISIVGALVNTLLMAYVYYDVYWKEVIEIWKNL